MAPYLAVAVVVSTLAALSEALQNHFGHVRQAVPKDCSRPRGPTWTFFDLLAVAALIIFSGLRHNVGTDYWLYAFLFERLDTSDWSAELAASSQEVGFTTLMLVVKSMTDAPQAIFLVVAVLTVIPTYLAIKRQSLSPALAVALYLLMAYYATSFNAVRQSLAAALLLLGWTYLGERNKRFVLLVLLAGSIHLTALMAAVVLVVARKWTPTFRTAVLILAAAATMGVALDRVPLVADWLSAVNPRYGDYLDSGLTGLGAYLQIAANLALLVFALQVGDRRKEMSPRDRQMAVYALIGVAVMFLGTQSVVIFRMAAYFSIFLVLLVPNRIAGAKDRVLGAALVLTGAATYYVMHLTHYGDVIPYRTYLS